MLKLNLNAKPFEPKKKSLDEVDNNFKFDMNCKGAIYLGYCMDEASLRKIEGSQYANDPDTFHSHNYLNQELINDYVSEKSLKDADRECSICLEKIIENNLRFGLLLNCIHVFCLNCIKQWRKNHLKHSKKEFHRLCPNCKKESYYVIPSNIYIQNYEEKLRIANEYKSSMGKIPCKYVKNGIDECPFGSSCFYLHLDQSGNKLDYDTLMISSDGKLIKHEKYYSDYVKELLQNELK